jgi:hypothetical protein
MLTAKFQERYQKNKNKPPVAYARYLRLGALMLIMSLATYALLSFLIPRTKKAAADITPMIAQQGKWLYQIILPSHPPLLIVQTPQMDNAYQQLYLAVSLPDNQQEHITENLRKIGLQYSFNKASQQISIGPIQNYAQLNRAETALRKSNCTAKHVLQH